jgi:hypothetical protein
MFSDYARHEENKNAQRHKKKTYQQIFLRAPFIFARTRLTRPEALAQKKLFGLLARGDIHVFYGPEPAERENDSLRCRRNEEKCSKKLENEEAIALAPKLRA